MTRWVTILLAVLGLAVAIVAVSSARDEKAELPLARPASVNPFASGVAALGIVEPTGRDVAIVAPEAGLVAAVHAEVGRAVKAGEPLFELDTRVLRADLIRARASVESAKAEIARWHALPRAEDLPPLEAAVARARAQVADIDEQLRLTEQTVSRGAGTDRDVSSVRYAAEAARADLARAEADLAKARAGGWEPDLAIARAQLAQREAEVAALEMLMGRLVVRAPRDGVVLRRGVEPGEYATTDASRPPMILGDLSRLSVRAQVDEEDIALVGNEPKAVARTRGSVQRDVPLRLTRIEPYARPKTDLSGANVERVDTRVIDVVFEVTAPPDTPLFPGQAVDVFIEASAALPRAPR